jgi:hypothetical protein
VISNNSGIVIITIGCWCKLTHIHITRIDQSDSSFQSLLCSV